MKILLLIIMLVWAPFNLRAQTDNATENNLVLYGAYNILENKPMAGMTLGCDLNHFVFELEMGWSYMSYVSTNHFYYVCPSVGAVWGKRYQIYILAGISQWVYMHYSEKDNVYTFYSDAWFPKLKLGNDIYISKQVFINLELQYAIPIKSSGMIPFQNLAFKTGIGFSF